ncbi:MAG TPA: glycine betaine ABC transporter substrate-binding protein [Gammaproteobacteria bacterium]|nr:glycine betaine ABC transporter substrate-binding protein [Gammaproteobacteria bacterium]
MFRSSLLRLPHAAGRRGLALTLCAAVLSLSACKGRDAGQAQTDNGRETLRVAYVNWADSIAITQLVAAILEDKMGYDVKLTLADVAPVYTAVAHGDQDLFMNAWLPVTHSSYWQRYSDELEDLGPNYRGAKIGLVVPDYAPGQSIADLNANRDAYSGKIIGIDPGAGIMEKTGQAIDAYDLDYHLVQSSGPAMTAALEQAIERREPIVVTGWQPHWMFARWKLRFLDDPKGVYGESEEIRAVARAGFSADYPEVAAFLKRFELSSEQLASLMNEIRGAKDGRAGEAAHAWMVAHPTAVAAWVGTAGQLGEAEQGA